jgi:hypothetical protein
MTIEIHQPEFEALIEERMQTGAFASVEDVLLQALKASPKPAPVPDRSGRTGADLIAALQACPLPYFDFEPRRYPMPVRNPEF